MTALSRSFLDFNLKSIHLDLLRRCGCHSVFSRRESSKIPPIDDWKVQKTGEKSARGSTREKNEKKAKSNSKANVKVCIIGAGVTPLYTAILLKQYRNIGSIRLVDTRESTPETLTNASHLETSPRIDYFQKKDIKQALREANIVALMDETDVAATGSNVTVQEQFKLTADYVRQMTDRILRFNPDALVAVFARPVTATLAMVSEIFRSAGWWNPDRIVGSTSTYGGRIEETAATILNLERTSLSVPLAGGADARTVVPLLSRAVPFNQFTNVQRKTLLQSFRTGDGEARTGLDESRSLSSGTAAAKLIINLAAGLSGHDRVITCAYVRSDVLPVCRFFTSELEFGPEGVKRNLGLPKISAAEVLLIDQAIPLINEHVDMAVAAVRTEKTRTRMQ